MSRFSQEAPCHVPCTLGVVRSDRWAGGSGARACQRSSCSTGLLHGASHRQHRLARRDRRLTDEGVLVIDAQRFRTQDRNRQDARERLVAFIAAGLAVPKHRVATRPTRASFSPR